MLARGMMVVSCAALAIASSMVSAGAITTGNLLIYRVGAVGATVALPSTATAVFLDEYSPSGTLVQTIAVPTTGSTAQLTATGNGTTEGMMALSQDGKLVTFTGYRLNVGVSPTSGNVGAIPRVIGIVDFSGNVNTAQAINASLANGTGTSAVRSVATVDGSSFYIGAATKLSYVPNNNPATVTADRINPLPSNANQNVRQVRLFNNELFGAVSGSATTQSRIGSYGILPTTAAPAGSPTSLIAAPTTGSTPVFDTFAILDLSSTVAGPDTIYALQTTDGFLQKYSFDGSTWTLKGQVATTALNITTRYFGGSDVELYLTSPTTLFKAVDSSGIGQSLAANLQFETLATASTNTAFRGVAAVPEPSALGLLALAMPLVSRRRR